MIELTPGEAKALIVVLADASDVLEDSLHIPLAFNLRAAARLVAMRLMEADGDEEPS